MEAFRQRLPIPWQNIIDNKGALCNEISHESLIMADVASAREAGKGAKYPSRPIRIMVPAAAGGGLGSEELKNILESSIIGLKDYIWGKEVSQSCNLLPKT